MERNRSKSQVELVGIAIQDNELIWRAVNLLSNENRMPLLVLGLEHHGSPISVGLSSLSSELGWLAVIHPLFVPHACSCGVFFRC